MANYKKFNFYVLYIKNQKNIHLKIRFISLHKNQKCNYFCMCKIRSIWFYSECCIIFTRRYQLVVKDILWLRVIVQFRIIKKLASWIKYQLLPFEDLSLILKNADALITIVKFTFEAMIKKIPNSFVSPFEIVRNSMIVKFKDYKEVWSIPFRDI